MALPHQSVATIHSPQFINLQPLDINPLMSQCEIKVLYVGENRNRSYISKEVAMEMSKTLRGAPIVGYYNQNKEDFADHGEQIVIDDEGIHFNTLTKPYGFVSPDAKVWFQKFEDKDQFGNVEQREYLMTTGYLWTGQFEQAQAVFEGGKPQSMELDQEKLQGKWATNVKNNMEFFIINDAIFTKLCILGDDVEPCFEGAAVTEPDISLNFSQDVDKNFTRPLFSMMKELQDALKGGYDMEKEEKIVETTFTEGQQESSEPVAETTFETSETVEAPAETFEKKEEEEKESEATEEAKDDDEEKKSGNFVKEDDKEKEEEEASDSKSDSSDEADTDEDEDKKKYSLLEQQYEQLQSDYTQLKTDYDELVAFKLSVENKEKDALIAEFYMLSDEDKKDVVENKAQYTLDEIKAKLAVICYEKKVNFSSESSDKIEQKVEEKNIDKDIVTFSYNDNVNLPDWVKAVKNIEDSEN